MSASRTRLPRYPIRVPSWFRFRVSIPWIFRIPKASRWSLPVAPGKDRSRRRWPLKPAVWPTTSTSQAAYWAGRPRDCRPRPAADPFMTSMNKVFADLPVTIFEAMSQLARANNAINLGQGFPDHPGPEDIRRAAADAVMDGYNQYPSMMGIPELRQAIAAHYGRWHGLTLDPMTEVMVTSGGTEALTSSILAVVEPGDEVVAFQPVYDSYLPIIRQAGGIPRLVRLEPPHWRLTEEALRSVFNHKTKAVLFNNPLNPAAVVYPREDLELLARFCQEFDTIAICDEVGACDLRWPRAYSADCDSGNARPHHQGRLGRQDFFADGLEDRLRLRRAAAVARRCEGAPVSHLHHRAQSSGSGRLWSRQAGGLFLPDAQGIGAKP